MALAPETAMRTFHLRRYHWMLLLLGSALALLALMDGCAAPGTRMVSPSSGPVPASLASADLTGTWRGSFGQVAASLYLDDGDCTLQIREDGTFTAIVTRSKAGTNNLAKPATWSGTVMGKGNRVILRSSQRPWVSLVRSGNSLYAVAEDPLVEATIMMTLEREGSAG
jgi:hypothetical protein